MLTRTLVLASALSFALAMPGHAFASTDNPTCDTGSECGSQSGDNPSIDPTSKDSVDTGTNDSRDATKDSAKDAASRDASNDTGKDAGSKDAHGHDSGKGHK
jgi:hypothetical protein